MNYSKAVNKAYDMFPKVFYNDSVTFIKKTQSGGYSRKETSETLCIIAADVQPYSGELAKKEYGIEAECVRKMFCDKSELVLQTGIELDALLELCSDDMSIKEGMYAMCNGTEYRVRYIEEWCMGAVCIMEKTNDGF